MSRQDDKRRACTLIDRYKNLAQYSLETAMADLLADVRAEAYECAAVEAERWNDYSLAGAIRHLAEEAAR